MKNTSHNPPLADTSPRILIIGGAGYIGSVLCRKLLKLGYRVRILDLLLYGDESIKDLECRPGFECHSGDFRQADTVVEAMDEVDAVVHLGAIVGDQACALNGRVTIETNLVATRLIAQIAKAFGIKRMVFASTCSVYGASTEHLNEQSKLNPVSLYARTKIGAEQALLAMSGNGFAPVILRFATVYGISHRPRFDLVVNLLSAMATVNRKITITGGKQWRPFVHVENVADAIIKALEAPRLLVNGEVFNVGSTDENYRIEQVGDIIKQLLPETDIICRENIIDQRNYFVRFDKIKNILNFATSKTVGDGVKEISQALRIGKIMNYQEPNYNNYLALKDNCHDYISSNKWYDLLQSIESEESADREKETVPLASAVRNKTNPPKADQVTQIRPGRTLAAKF